MNKKGLVLLIILSIGIVSILLISKGEKEQSKKATVGLDAPLFELKDVEGKTWRLSDLKGKIVIINFWASWCDTCKEEKPYIINVLNRLKNEKLIYLSILYNNKPSEAISYMKSSGFDFPVLIDDKHVASDYGLTGVPETFIVDKKGVLAKKFIGGVHWNLDDFVSTLQRLIDE
jgi:cytochrome c biogenesis protein CcmG/thiol:disulfide interchange protein DsbE